MRGFERVLTDNCGVMGFLGCACGWAEGHLGWAEGYLGWAEGWAAEGLVDCAVITHLHPPGKNAQWRSSMRPLWVTVPLTQFHHHPVSRP